MASLRIGDIDLYYREAGAGPPLILLMGFTANADWWPPEFLRELAQHFRVLAIDNRGAGRTPRGSKRFSMKQAADDTVAFMDALNIPKAHVFGISMGGMIVQELAAQHPTRVDRLILGCTMQRPRTGFLSGLPGQARLLLRYLLDKKVRSRPWVVNIMFSRRFLQTHPGIPFEFIRMVSKARIKPKAWREQLLAIMRFNAAPKLKAIHHPALVIAGSEDLLIASSQSRRLAAGLANARLIILPGLGHAFVGEDPGTVLQHVVPFLAPQNLS